MVGARARGWVAGKGSDVRSRSRTAPPLSHGRTEQAPNQSLARQFASVWLLDFGSVCLPLLFSRALSNASATRDSPESPCRLRSVVACRTRFGSRPGGTRSANGNWDHPMMYLIQLLLPLRDNGGIPFPRRMFEQVRSELTERFGGVTAYLRSPASGVWKDDQGEVARDEMVMVEVMVNSLDRPWWDIYRRDLEGRFRQAELLMRALGCERL
jgi:hypothetical protein